VIVRSSNQDHRTSVLEIVHAFGDRADLVGQLVQALNSVFVSRRDHHDGDHHTLVDAHTKPNARPGPPFPIPRSDFRSRYTAAGTVSRTRHLNLKASALKRLKLMQPQADHAQLQPPNADRLSTSENRAPATTVIGPASVNSAGGPPALPIPSIGQIVLLKEQESESSPGRKTAGVEGPFSGPLFLPIERRGRASGAQRMLISGREWWRVLRGDMLLKKRLVRF
jgi:hypothetical protein